MTKTPAIPTLADVDLALDAAGLSPTRLRDLRSALRRIAREFDLPADRIVLEMATLRERLDGTQPVGVSKKTWTTLRSNFLAAIDASGLKPVVRTAALELDGPWVDLVGKNGDRRIRFGLSRFARWCSLKAIAPFDVDDDLLDRYFEDVRDKTLVRNVQSLKGIVPGLWSRLRKQRPELDLPALTVGKGRRVSTRVGLTDTPARFRRDWEKYVAWATGANPFAEDARARPVSNKTAGLHLAYVRAALTALRADDPDAPPPETLAELVSYGRMRVYLDVRDRAVGRNANVFNFEMAKNLVAIARGYVRMPERELERLKKLVSALKKPPNRMAAKNTALLRQFDDPDLVVRLLELPARAWPQIKGETPSFHELAKAQGVLAVALLTHLPLRVANLAALKFGETLFLPKRDDRETQVSFPAEAMKNREPFGGVLPPKITRLLRLYRDAFLIPSIAGEPAWVFARQDGERKGVQTVSQMVVQTVERCLGLDMSAHQFRHLMCKLILDADPGAYETVRQLCGHRGLEVTMRFYAGIDTRRAGRHYTRLLEKVVDQRRAGRAATKPAGADPVSGAASKGKRK